MSETAKVTFSDGSTATLTGTREEIEEAVRQIEEGMKPEGGPIVGALEVAAQIGSASIIEPFAGVTGVAAGLGHRSAEVGSGVVGAVQERGTYEPRTRTGQRYSRNLAETMAPVSEALESVGDQFGERGADLLSPLGLEAAGYAAGQTFTPAMGAAVGGLGGAAAVNRARTMRTKPVREDPYIEKRKKREDREAKRDMEYQGMDPDLVEMFRKAPPTDKNAMREMVDVVERSLKDPLWGEINRPSAVLGRNIEAQYKFVERKRKEAGNKLDVAAGRLKGKEVDYEGPVNAFLDGLDDMGIGFQAGKLDFRGSDIQDIPGLESTLNRLVKRMADVDKPDAYAVHQLKRWIDNNVSYTKKTEGLTAQVEILMKGLRHDLDSVLDGKFPEYDHWNNVYRETKQATQGMQDAIPRKANIEAPNADRALGIESRKLLSNYASGSALSQALDDLMTVANKHGGGFEDNILMQQMFDQQLRNAFPRLEARKRTFAGETQRAAEIGAQAVRDPKGTLLDKAMEVGTEAVMGKRDEATRLKALKRLLSEPTPRPQRITGPQQSNQ